MNSTVMWKYIENYVSNVTAVYIGILILTYVLLKKVLQNKKLPPGPIGLPIVGYIPFLGKNPHLTLIKLSKKYGNIFSMYLGNRYVVVLGDFPSIKEAFSKQSFNSRPPDSPFSIAGPIGFGDLSGHPWQEQRKVALQVLRNLGFKSSRLENQIKAEIAETIEVIEKLKGKPIVIDEMLLSSVSNNISSLVFGRRFDFNDSRRKALDTVIIFTSKVVGPLALHAFMPWIKILLKIFSFGSYAKLKPVLDTYDKFVTQEIEDHKKTLDNNDSRDFIDGFLMEINKRNGGDSVFNIHELDGNIKGLFGAGSETVRTTLSWTFLIMAMYPEVQRKVQKEIDDIIGRDRTPCWEDNKRLPYTQAVLLEISRWKAVIPLNLLHYTDQDSTVGKYDIPKGTTILANLWAVHHDPSYWKNPDTFMPERFLDKEGKTVVKSERLIPFSYGKRSCPGETMALVETFLYTTNFLQRFDIKLEDGAVPDLEGVLGISLQPKSHKIRLISRQ